MWSCGACTFRNRASSSTCTVCSEPKVSGSAVDAGVAAGNDNRFGFTDNFTVCPHCTLRNRAAANSCEACGLPFEIENARAESMTQSASGSLFDQSGSTWMPPTAPQVLSADLTAFTQRECRDSVTRDGMSLLRNCMANLSAPAASKRPSAVLAASVDHLSQRRSAGSFFACGYRNIQMLCSALMREPAYKAVLFGGCGYVPDIAGIQMWIERAWEQGFDPTGREQMGGQLLGTSKWIGSAECAALLRSFGIPAKLVAFHALDDPMIPQVFDAATAAEVAESRRIAESELFAATGRTAAQVNNPWRAARDAAKVEAAGAASSGARVMSPTFPSAIAGGSVSDRSCGAGGAAAGRQPSLQPPAAPSASIPPLQSLQPHDVYVDGFAVIIDDDVTDGGATASGRADANAGGMRSEDDVIVLDDSIEHEMEQAAAAETVPAGAADANAMEDSAMHGTGGDNDDDIIIEDATGPSIAVEGTTNGRVASATGGQLYSSTAPAAAPASTAAASSIIDPATAASASAATAGEDEIRVELAITINDDDDDFDSAYDGDGIDVPSITSGHARSCAERFRSAHPTSVGGGGGSQRANGEGSTSGIDAGGGSNQSPWQPSSSSSAGVAAPVAQDELPIGLPRASIPMPFVPLPSMGHSPGRPRQQGLGAAADLSGGGHSGAASSVVSNASPHTGSGAGAGQNNDKHHRDHKHRQQITQLERDLTPAERRYLSKRHGGLLAWLQSYFGSKMRVRRDLDQHQPNLFARPSGGASVAQGSSGCGGGRTGSKSTTILNESTPQDELPFPVFFQHDGHSRTLVGWEVRLPDNPSISTSGSRSGAGAGAGRGGGGGGGGGRGRQGPPFASSSTRSLDHGSRRQHHSVGGAGAAFGSYSNGAVGKRGRHDTGFEPGSSSTASSNRGAAGRGWSAAPAGSAPTSASGSMHLNGGTPSHQHHHPHQGRSVTGTSGVTCDIRNFYQQVQRTSGAGNFVSRPASDRRVGDGNDARDAPTNNTEEELEFDAAIEANNGLDDGNGADQDPAASSPAASGDQGGADIDDLDEGGDLQISLLIFDPSTDAASMSKALHANKGWQRIIKRGLHTLRHPVYEAVYVPRRHPSRSSPASARDAAAAGCAAMASGTTASSSSQLHRAPPYLVPIGTPEWHALKVLEEEHVAGGLQL